MRTLLGAERFEFRLFIGHVTQICHQPEQLRVTTALEVVERAHDVAGGVEAHHLARGDDGHLVGILAAQRHGETAAHHVPEHVVQHDVGLELLVGMQLFKQVERGDDAAARAADAGNRAAGLHA